MPSQVTHASTWKITSNLINISRSRTFDAFMPISKHSRYWKWFCGGLISSISGRDPRIMSNQRFLRSLIRNAHVTRAPISTGDSFLSWFVMGEIILEESSGFRIKAWSWPTFIINSRYQRFYQSRKSYFAVQCNLRMNFRDTFVTAKMGQI